MTLILLVHIVLSQSKCSLERRDVTLVTEPVSDSPPDLTARGGEPCTDGFSININCAECDGIYTLLVAQGG